MKVFVVTISHRRGVPPQQVTDVGLEHLKGLTNLRYLDLKRTKVTNEGVMQAPAGVAQLQDHPLKELVPSPQRLSQ